MEEKNNKTQLWNMRVNGADKSNIARLAHRLRVSESDAVRIAVSVLLQSDGLPQLPARMRRPRSIRRKAAA